MDEETPKGEVRDLWRLERVFPENESVTSIVLSGTDPKMAARRAGQFAVLRLPAPGGWSDPHPFTISAAPEDPEVRMTIKREGAFTASIRDLKPGTAVRLAGPFGTFCRDIEKKRQAVMIAGGVGITPFLSVLRHLRHVASPLPVTLFWSNKTYNDIFAADELKELTGLISLRVVHCLSREEDVSPYRDGRFPAVSYEAGRLSARILEAHGVTKEEAVYLCGPPAMMDATLGELASLGIPPAAVEREQFVWKAKGG